METVPLNQAVVKDGVMTVTLYLHGKDAAFAEAIGALVLAQDMVKQYFTEAAVKEMMRVKSTGIIKPN